MGKFKTLLVKRKPSLYVTYSTEQTFQILKLGKLQFTKLPGNFAGQLTYLLLNLGLSHLFKNNSCNCSCILSSGRPFK
ncbi:hypothetical protein ABIE54_004304 [Chitinophagaceae bacterium OAS944]